MPDNLVTQPGSNRMPDNECMYCTIAATLAPNRGLCARWRSSDTKAILTLVSACRIERGSTSRPLTRFPPELEQKAKAETGSSSSRTELLLTRARSIRAYVSVPSATHPVTNDHETLRLLTYCGGHMSDIGLRRFWLLPSCFKIDGLPKSCIKLNLQLRHLLTDVS